MHPILTLIYQVLNLYSWVVIISVILSLLINFNIINRYQPFVQQFGVLLARLTEPALGRIRRYVPSVGGFDLSPIILIMAINFAMYCIVYWGAPRIDITS